MSLQNCRIVLVRPHYAGNLGATARVMRNFGLSDLVLVAPYASTSDLEARRLATHGLPVLDAARVVPEFADAVADCVQVFATSALTAGVYRKGFTGTAAEKMPALLAAAESGPVAVVFGPEPHGLSNAEVARCHGLVHIPVDPECPALNLAQSVAICCYELRKAWYAATHPAPVEQGEPVARRGRKPAPFGDLERVFEHLREALTAVGYLYGPKADSLMHGIRQLLARAAPTPQEVKLLHGLARQLLYVAGKRPHSGEPGRDTPAPGDPGDTDPPQ